MAGEILENPNIIHTWQYHFIQQQQIASNKGENAKVKTVVMEYVEKSENEGENEAPLEICYNERCKVYFTWRIIRGYYYFHIAEHFD